MRERVFWKHIQDITGKVHFKMKNIQSNNVYSIQLSDTFCTNHFYNL